MMTLNTLDYLAYKLQTQMLQKVELEYLILVKAVRRGAV